MGMRLVTGFVLGLAVSGVLASGLDAKQMYKDRVKLCKSSGELAVSTYELLHAPNLTKEKKQEVFLDYARQHRERAPMQFYNNVGRMATDTTQAYDIAYKLCMLYETDKLLLMLDDQRLHLE